jgi:hypothetical protein
MRILTFVISAAALLCGLTLVSPLVSASEDLQFTFGAPIRTSVPIAPPGTAVGNILVTSGDVIEPKTRKRLGFYATNQITVRSDATTGREIRKVDLSISLPRGDIFATALIRVVSGQPPTTQQRFALTGGTGLYAGIQGTLTHDAIADRPEFNVRINVLRRG